ncbi:hypothetical protein GCM10010412_006100 [Nonomuraea recticatena]|uniref:Gram-positive cocci surface proteins LPxTG domain-containing protein n=1 Tax=Nonomuraea recticatena TaxID=46178 RepID=A0ABN3R665_9ACTN
MQKSKARRRLALKTSALGLAGTLALFVGSIVGLASSAEAAAEVAAAPSMTVTFNCTGGPFAGHPVTATISGPESVAPGGSVELKWTFTAKPKAARDVTAGTMTIEGDVNVATIAAPTVTAQKTSVPVPALATGAEFTAVPELVGTFTAPTTTGQLTVTPVPAATGGSLYFTLSTSDETECTPTTGTAPSMVIQVKTGGGTGTGGETVVAYKCATSTNTDSKDTSLNVTMTMPTGAEANKEQSINWSATYASGAAQLTVPASGFTSAKFIASASVSGAGVSGTSVTGETTFSTTTAGSPITSFPSVTLKVKPTTAGTVTLKASDIYFGTSTSVYQYKCTVQASPAPKGHSFTVTAASASPSPSPSPSASTSASAKPTRTVTATVTQTPVGGGNGKVTKTPKGAAETGGGGDMGPDGRMFVLTGSLVVLAAAAGGLVLRRRSVSRG